MKESYCYKKGWQEHYGKYPHGEKSEGYDISPEEFANSMMENFKTSGILDLMKKKEVSMLASSVGTGKKDWELLRQLDGYLGKSKKFHKPRGKIIFDCAGRVASPPSTAKLIRMTAKKDVRSFFEELGFEVEVAGKDEKFIVLTNPLKS